MARERDLSQLSDAELAQIAGVPLDGARNLEKLSDQELANIAGINLPKVEKDKVNTKDFLFRGLQKAVAFKKGAEQGVTLGFSDEAKAALQAPVTALLTGQSLPETFESIRQEERLLTKAFKELEPVATTIGEVSGAALSPIGGGPLRAATLPGRIVESGARGLGLGALAGLGTAEGDLQEQAAQATLGGVTGGAVGAAFPVAGAALRPLGRQIQRLRGEQLPSRAKEFIEDVITREEASPEIIRENIRRSREAGIPLTLAEITESPTLGRVQTVISEGGGPAARTIREFAVERKEASIPEAIQRTITNITPETDPTTIGRQLQASSQRVISEERKRLSNKAGPFYKKAFEQNVDQDTLSGLLSDPIVARSADRVRTDPVFRRDLAGFTESSGKFLDLVKRNMDDQISAASRAGDQNRARIIADAKQGFVQRVDRIIPDYKTARVIFSEEVSFVKGITDGIIGTISDLNENQIETAGRKLFKLTPNEFKKTFNLIKASEDDELSQRALGSYLNEAFEGVKDNRWNSMRSKVFGNKAIRSKINVASKDKEQFNQIKNLFESIDLAYKIRGGSDTAPKQETQEILRQQLGSGFGRVVRNAKEAADFVANWVDDKLLEKNFNELSDLLISPEGREFIQQLDLTKAKKPKPEDLIRLSSVIFGLESQLNEQ